MANHAGVFFMTVCSAVLIIAVLATGCTSSPGPVTPSAVTPVPAGSAPAVTIQNFAFSPAAITVAAGTTVTWTNKDGVPHTVTSDAGAPAAFDSGPVVNGGTYQFTFTKSGVYTYHCAIHPQMTGTITVQ